MTKQEIMELKGRELDVAVADALGLEYEYIYPDPECQFGGAVYASRHEWIVDDYVTPKRRTGGCELLPHYSTDISAAWSLLEELHTKPYSVEVFLVHECESEIKYIVNVLLMHEFTKDLMADRSMISVFSNTAPEAICKAYLLWKHEEEEQK